MSPQRTPSWKTVAQKYLDEQPTISAWDSPDELRSKITNIQSSLEKIIRNFLLYVGVPLKASGNTMRFAEMLDRFFEHCPDLLSEERKHDLSEFRRQRNKVNHEPSYVPSVDVVQGYADLAGELVSALLEQTWTGSAAWDGASSRYETHQPESRIRGRDSQLASNRAHDFNELNGEVRCSKCGEKVGYTYGECLERPHRFLRMGDEYRCEKCGERLTYTYGDCLERPHRFIRMDDKFRCEKCGERLTYTYGDCLEHPHHFVKIGGEYHCQKCGERPEYVYGDCLSR